jgi:hypothetical protein
LERRTLLIVTGCVAPAVIVALGVMAVLGAGVFGSLVFSDDFYPRGDLADATREESALAGYTVPDGAQHVYVKDRSLQDVRVSWFRFDLPPDVETRLQAQYAGHEDRQKVAWSGKLPAHWPQWTTFEDFGQPEWWAPAEGATGYARESSAGGALIVFGDGHVFNLLWTFEGWRPPS